MSKTKPSNEILGYLKRHWGYDRLLPNQEQAIQATLERRDSLVVLSTGGGKSLCYQLPALATDGMAIVVSPLLSLIKDQVDALRANGITGASLNSMLALEEKRQLRDAIRAGAVKILYLAPESFRGADGGINQGLVELLKAGNPSFIAVDEAHCISQWGHEFRPSYRVLGDLRAFFPACSIHAYTATATEAVRQDIVESLALKNCLTMIGSFDRPNLVYRVAYRQDLLAQLEEVLGRHAGEGGIVYCIRKKDVDSLCDQLRARGYRALPYHAGLSDDVRRQNQEAFIKEEVDIVVATVAFGMGIDRQNVRFVVHAGMPKSLENYQQEAGRAGRDGLESECLLLHSAGDAMLWRRIQGDNGADNDHNALARLDAMQRYCQSFSCRHGLLADYFGETLEKDNCGACDVCLGEQERHPESLEIARAIARCIKETRERFGATYLKDILKGSETAKILSNRHDELCSHGALKEYAATDIRDWLEQLIEQDAMQRETEFQVLKLTDKGRRLTDEEDAIEVSLTRPRAKKPKSKTSAATDPRFQDLRSLRKRLADERGVPPYIILHDKTLLEIIRLGPATLDELQRVKGLGEAKIREFGDRILEVVSSWQPSESARASRQKGETLKMTLEYFQEGLDPQQIALQRGLAESTVQNHLESLILEGEVSLESLVSREQEREIQAAVATLGVGAGVSFLQLLLPATIGYGDIRYVLADLRAKGHHPELEMDADAVRMRALVQAALDKDSGEVGAISECLASDSIPLRKLAALALGKIATQSASEALADALTTESEPSVAQSLEKALEMVERGLARA